MHFAKAVHFKETGISKVIQKSQSLSGQVDLTNLFLLSFHDRDPLASRVSAGGWYVSSARRKDGLRGRFLSSNALIALVDLRDAVDDGLAAIAELAGLDEQRRIAILALADQSGQGNIAAKCYDAGATHFLDIANPYADLEQAIKFAYRYVENVHGGAKATNDFNRLLIQAGEQWSFSKLAISQNWISEKLRSNLSAVNFDIYPVTGIYRILAAEERLRVRGAMGRLRAGATQAAVAHLLHGEKIIHHLHDSGDKIQGSLERVSDNETDLGWTGRDLLSGLRNGSAARNWMRRRLANHHKIGLVMFGLKNFATINAAYGRAIGDEIMRRIGQRLITETMAHPLDNCLVARMDGQNFVVATQLESASDEIANTYTDYAEELLSKVFAPISIEARDIGLVARAGVAISEESADETLLVRRATLALAEAMLSDALPLRVSNSSEKNILLEQQLEADLVHALERGDIAIALQPQIKVRTGQLVGAEALARWDHPTLGFLGAATLFSVAERAGLMELLSSHIHKLAFETAGQWPESLSFLRLSINITAGDLANADFVKNMMRGIDHAGFEAARTTLEITESELIGDLKSAARRLAALQEQGLQIAIDDFGTGYSSLAYLKNLPLDYLKIDSGLTSDISGSSKDQVVVKSIIKMGHSLGLSVIAEGVETEAQLATLADQGCEYFQGFLRSGPISAEEFEIFALLSN
ncbi:putative bifunctional diguanylate cyclase/phosphodiesterase [Parasphingorhabdus cellanae]|uniref:EAL domain-containing protein n=1 Tax=Parasphingorhabdus cellanae TaxID=2806553 RepID=A0ABX7T5P8_9SPHN|nr:GGDEF domain-containing phosphodiesterase [Parasphingorhabdus cellanae]QTD56150.1 EAL domain-containing protein [Parasphingorhabdus cellanae]